MKLKIAFLKQVNAVLQFIMDTLTDSLPNVCQFACKPLLEANHSVVKLVDNIMCVVEKNSYKCLSVKVCKTVHDNGNVSYDLGFSNDEGYKQSVSLTLPIGRNNISGSTGMQNLVKIVIVAVLVHIKNNKSLCASVFG